MPTLRREALETISNKFEIGTWPDLNSALADREVIVPFDVDAAFDEGQELDDRDVSYIEADDRPYEHAAEDCVPLSDEEAPAAASSHVVPFQPWDPDAPLPVQESAQAYVDQHQRLTEMFKLAQTNGSAHLAMHCKQALHRLEKVHKSERWGGNALIKKWLRDKRDLTQAEVHKLQAYFAETKRAERRLQKVKLRHRTRHHLVKEETKRRTRFGQSIPEKALCTFLSEI